MVKCFRTVLILLCAGLAGCGAPEKPGLNLADGRSAPTELWQERYLAINYWAKWCAPCREEIGELNALHADRVNHNVVVLGVNYDGLRGERLQADIVDLDIKFPVLNRDPNVSFGYEVPSVLPTTFVLSPERKVIAVLKGPQTMDSILRATQGSTRM